jgi:signal transduction histidine kinase
MDEIVWAVNPRHDTLDSLASYLGRFAQDLLRGTNLRCRLNIPVRLPAWPLTAETRHNLFLAFKEALHNAVKHANASEIQVSLDLEPRGFVLRVDDNGRGFNSEPRPGDALSEPIAARNGLVNMRRRLEEIGGQFQIQSEIGRGTQVRFTVQIGECHEN